MSEDAEILKPGDALRVCNCNNPPAIFQSCSEKICSCLLSSWGSYRIFLPNSASRFTIDAHTATLSTREPESRPGTSIVFRFSDVLMACGRVKLFPMLCKSWRWTLMNINDFVSAGGNLNSASASAVNSKSLLLNSTRSKSWQDSHKTVRKLLVKIQRTITPFGNQMLQIMNARSVENTIPDLNGDFECDCLTAR